MTDLKQCRKCGEHKERTEYFRDKKSADGVQGKCKVCAKADARRAGKARCEAQRQIHTVVIEPAPKPDSIEVHWLTKSWRAAA